MPINCIITFLFNFFQNIFSTFEFLLGLPIQYISKRLGHADVHTTLKTYSYLIKEFEDNETKFIEKNLNGLLCD